MIKRVGSGLPVNGPSSVETSKSNKASFSDVKSATSVSAPRDISSDSAVVRAAVEDVAARIASGAELSQAGRVDAVIERMVELRLGTEATPSTMRERVEDVKAVLGEHPAFAANVGALLESCLGGSE